MRGRKRELELRDFSRKQRHGDVANMAPFEVAALKARKREKLRKIEAAIDVLEQDGAGDLAATELEWDFGLDDEIEEDLVLVLKSVLTDYRERVKGS